jgi:HEAT repeat protein
VGDERAIPLLIERESSGDSGVKYAALFALGFFDDPRAIDALKKGLSDPDPLAEWNAAFSLARLSGRSGRPHAEAVPILKRLLDLDFVRRVAASQKGAVLSEEQIELYRIRAVQLLGIFLDDALRSELGKTAQGDPQLGVRQAAIDVLNGRKTVEENEAPGR